jgi:hypothetical protein
MNYEKIYNQIIERAKTRVLEGYKETHHIIPRCIGGADDRDNLVDLTAREHFICHWLLIRIYPDNNKLWFAVNMMSNSYGNYKQHRDYKVSSKQYNEIKSNLKHSEETKRKLSAARKGKPGREHTIETRIKLSQITNKRAKEILKKLGYNKYYEHIPFIKDKLGIKPPIMSSELEDTLCNLFMDIQGPYAKYCPDDRVNFLNYYYTVYKLCELLDQHQFLPYFPMLKDREKRIEQDEIWRNICDELDWEYIPTI